MEAVAILLALPVILSPLYIFRTTGEKKQVWVVLGFFFIAAWVCVSFLFIDILLGFTAGWFRAVMLLLAAAFAAWRIRKSASAWRTMAFVTVFAALCLVFSESLFLVWLHQNTEPSSRGSFPAVLHLPRFLLIALCIALLIDSRTSQSEGRFPREYSAALIVFIAALSALPPWRPVMIVSAIALPLAFALTERSSGLKIILPAAMAGAFAGFALMRFVSGTDPAIYPFTHWATLPYTLLFGFSVTRLADELRETRLAGPVVWLLGLLAGWSCELMGGRSDSSEYDYSIFLLRNGLLAWIFVHIAAFCAGFAASKFQSAPPDARLREKQFWISGTASAAALIAAIFMAVQFRSVRTLLSEARGPGMFSPGLTIQRSSQAVCGDYERLSFRARIPGGPFRTPAYVSYKIGDISLPRTKLTAGDVAALAEELNAKVVFQDASVASANRFQSSGFGSSLNPLTSGVTFARESGEFVYISLDRGYIAAVTLMNDLTDGCSKGKLPYTFRENPAFRKEYADRVQWIKPRDMIVLKSGPSVDAPAQTGRPVYNLFYGMVVPVVAEVESDGGWYLTEAGFARKENFMEFASDPGDELFEDKKNQAFEAARPGSQDLNALLASFKASCEANGYGTGIIAGSSSWIDRDRFVRFDVQWKQDERKSLQAFVDFSGVEAPLGQLRNLNAEYVDAVAALAEDARAPAYEDAGAAVLVARTSVRMDCMEMPTEYDSGRPAYYANTGATVTPVRLQWKPPEMKTQTVSGIKVHYSSRLPRVGSPAAEKFCKKEGMRLPSKEELEKIQSALKPEAGYSRTSFWISTCKAAEGEKASEECRIEKSDAARSDDAAAVCVGAE